MATYAKIIGLQKLQKKLDAMPRVAKEEIRSALEKSADEIVAMAKNLAPSLKKPDTRKKNPRRPGELRDSIGWTYGKAPKGALTLGEVRASQLAGDLTITIFAGNSDAFYARWVEFGTQKMSAQPYFYPSYRANKRRTRSRVTRAINRAAKKVASQ